MQQLLPRYQAQNIKLAELLFRALLTDGAPEVRFDVLVQKAPAFELSF